MPSDKLRIVQILKTMQGEGINVGVPSILIRLGDCNINCPFCDSKWATSENEKLSETGIVIESIEDIKTEIHKLKGNIECVMVTGGEPLLYSENLIFQEMIVYLLNSFSLVEIETNATRLNTFIPILKTWYRGKSNLRFNISPKLVQQWYHDPTEYVQMIENCKNIVTDTEYNCGFKFVDNGKPGGRSKIENFIKTIQIPASKISLMPLTPPRPDIGESYLKYLDQYRVCCNETLKYCIDNGYRFIPRIHVFLFEDEFEKI